MKGLWKHLTPFAPDQSGAVSVLYELGGILVVCDAGGCTGNICGFDEPRWFTHKCALFSAGLRDMDAILGRDDRLVKKLCDTAEKLQADFAAIIGTPVPAVIGTDFRALKRMAEKKVDLPILTVDATGMGFYDSGAEKAWLSLFRQFAVEPQPVDQACIGVIGLTPLDFGAVDAGAQMEGVLRAQGYQTVCCYGMGAGLDAIRKASRAVKNLVVSPSALKAAQYLQDTFGTPYEVMDPLTVTRLPDQDYRGRRVLVVHQQVTANTLREALLARGAAEVVTATWFMQKRELAQPGDVILQEEDQLCELVQAGNYDLLIGDQALWELLPDFSGETIDLPHFAVSGRLG